MLRKKISVVILCSIFLSIMAIFGFGLSSNAVFGHHLIDIIEVPRPMGMSIDEGMLYVSSMVESGVSVVNTTDDKIAYVINSTSKGGIIDAISVPPDKVYLAPFKSGTIEVYDKKTNNISNIIELPGAVYSTPTPLADRVLTAAEFVRGVWAMDYNPQNKILYAAYADANEILAINTTNDEIVAEIPVANHPMALQVDPLTNTVIVASLTGRTGNDLTFISTDTNQIIGEAKSGIGPWDIALDSLYHKAYVANRGSYFVTVVDTIGHQIIDKIPLSSPAQAIAVDEKDHVVYVTHPRSQNIDKINGETNEYITPIDLNMIPQDIVVDSDTQRVYISAKSQDRLFVIGPESVASSLSVISFDQPYLVLGFIDVHGQDVTPTSSFSLSNNTLGLSVSAPEGGNLAFDVPRALLDSKDGASDLPFRVLFDGQSSEFSHNIEITKTTDDPKGNETRSLDFYVPENTKTVTIVGTKSII